MYNLYDKGIKGYDQVATNEKRVLQCHPLQVFLLQNAHTASFLGFPWRLHRDRVNAPEVGILQVQVQYVTKSVYIIRSRSRFLGKDHLLHDISLEA